MNNYFSNINWGGTIFLLLVLVFIVAALLTIIENIKIKRRTFQNPESLDTNDAGRCFLVNELQDNKVLLEVLYSGWDDRTRLFNTEVWVKIENIPVEFLVVGKMCFLSRNEAGLCFNDYYMKPMSNLFQL